MLCGGPLSFPSIDCQTQMCLLYQLFFEIKINKKRFWFRMNKKAKMFEDVYVYASDPWYPQIHGYMLNFVFNIDDYQSQQTSPTSRK